MRPTLTTLIVVFVTTTTATLGQLVPPTEGYQLGGQVSPGGPSFDIIMPLTVAQCEPVIIYYNLTAWVTLEAPLSLVLVDPVTLFALASFQFALNVGYLEWICNIPAGEIFHVATVHAVTSDAVATYIVQPGTSACLGPLTTTYNSDLQYLTTAFAVYTGTLYHTSIYSVIEYPNPSTTFFPTGAFSTLTLNLAGASQTSKSTSTSTSISGPRYSPGSNQTYKSNPAGKMSGIVVGVVVFLLVVSFTFYLWRRTFRKPTISNLHDKDPPYGPPHERPMDSTVEAIPTGIMSRNQAAHQ